MICHARPRCETSPTAAVYAVLSVAQCTHAGLARPPEAWRHDELDVKVVRVGLDSIDEKLVSDRVGRVEGLLLADVTSVTYVWK